MEKKKEGQRQKERESEEEKKEKKKKKRKKRKRANSSGTPRQKNKANGKKILLDAPGAPILTSSKFPDSVLMTLLRVTVILIVRSSAEWSAEMVQMS